MLDKLIQKFMDGDESAFEELYNQTRKSVYYVALAVLRESALAEDVMQTTYLNVLKNISKYEIGTNASAWILRIARNEALNLKKLRSRECSVDEREHAELFGSTKSDDYGLLVDLARRILPDDEFTIVMLITACGYKRREIAKMFGSPTSTITWKYHSALAKMRKSLEQSL